MAAVSGCSSSPPPDIKNSTTSNTNSANAVTTAATNTNAPGGMAPYSGVQNINPNAFNASNDNLKAIQSQPKKEEIPYGTRTAPDESTVTVGSRGKDFVETRTFKNHATLAKVEKVMDGKTTEYKVFLKNGKVLDAPADKMNNFTALAPENILDAVGQLPKLPSAPEVKKEENPQ
jgi:hypothetical protein